MQQHLARDFMRGGGKEFDLRRYLFLLRRRLWLIVLVVTLSLVATYAWVSRQPREYSSRVVVQVEQREQRILNMQELQPQDLTSDDYLSTVVQSMTNQTLMLRAAKAAGLDRDPKLFPPRPDGQPYNDAVIAEAARRRVSAELRRGTRLIDISVLDEDPERAQGLADAVFREFLHQNFEQQLALSNTAMHYLEEQAAQQKQRVERTERELQTYREEHQAVSLDQSQNIVTDKLRDLNAKVTAAKDVRIQLAADLEQLQRVRPGDIKGMLQIASVASIPQVAQTQAQIVTATAEFRALEKRYGRNHPRYIQAATTLIGLQDTLLQCLEQAGEVLATRYAEANATEVQLTAVFHEQEGEALNLSNIAIPYNVLQRNLASERALYDSLVTRIGETNLSRGLEQSPFRLVEAPLVSMVPVRPQIGKTLTIGFVFSLMFCVVVIIGLDSINETLRSVDQAEEFLGMRALAVIPESRRRSHLPLPLVIVDEPSSRPAEAFRIIRASLSSLGPEESQKVLLFTSALPGEGKTFASLNLAASFAIAGLETVLVEADLRLPALHKATIDGIARPERPGVSDYLARRVSLDDALISSCVPNLSLMLAGNKCSNPAELLWGKRFDDLIQALANRFDRVIIDSPPLLSVSDTLTLIRSAHYVCLVVRPEKTPKKAIARCAYLIQSAGGKLAGFFLNQVNCKVGASYFYYCYGKRYSQKRITGLIG